MNVQLLFLLFYEGEANDKINKLVSLYKSYIYEIKIKLI